MQSDKTESSETVETNTLASKEHVASRNTSLSVREQLSVPETVPVFFQHTVWKVQSDEITETLNDMCNFVVQKVDGTSKALTARGEHEKEALLCTSPPLEPDPAASSIAETESDAQPQNDKVSNQMETEDDGNEAADQTETLCRSDDAENDEASDIESVEDSFGDDMSSTGASEQGDLAKHSFPKKRKSKRRSKTEREKKKNRKMRKNDERQGQLSASLESQSKDRKQPQTLEIQVVLKPTSSSTGQPVSANCNKASLTKDLQCLNSDITGPLHQLDCHEEMSSHSSDHSETPAMITTNTLDQPVFGSGITPQNDNQARSFEESNGPSFFKDLHPSAANAAHNKVELNLVFY